MPSPLPARCCDSPAAGGRPHEAAAGVQQHDAKLLQRLDHSADAPVESHADSDGRPVQRTCRQCRALQSTPVGGIKARSVMRHKQRFIVSSQSVHPVVFPPRRRRHGPSSGRSAVTNPGGASASVPQQASTRSPSGARSAMPSSCGCRGVDGGCAQLASPSPVAQSSMRATHPHQQSHVDALADHDAPALQQGPGRRGRDGDVAVRQGRQPVLGLQQTAREAEKAAGVVQGAHREAHGAVGGGVRVPQHRLLRGRKQRGPRHEPAMGPEAPNPDSARSPLHPPLAGACARRT